MTPKDTLVRIGSLMLIDTAEHRDKTYTVDAVRLVSRDIDGRTFTLKDHMISPVGKSDRNMIIRYDLDNEEETGEYLLLNLVDSFGYSEDFRSVLNSNDFTITDNDCDVTYYRLGDLKKPHDARIFSRGLAGKMTDRAIFYWDYARDYDSFGQVRTEFCFVEQDKSTGWQEIWVGSPVPTAAVSLL